MRFTIRMATSEEDCLAAEGLGRWAQMVRLPLEVQCLSPGERPPEDSRLLLWDLDGGGAPPEAFCGGLQSGQALVLCASGAGKAIDSYAMHPVGFLKKPLEIGALRHVLDKTVTLWHDELERVDVLCGGFKRSVPLHDLLWAESSHTRRSSTPTVSASRPGRHCGISTRACPKGYSSGASAAFW